MTQARMPLGIVLPNEVRDLAALARTIEDLGYDVVASGEHVAFHGPVPNSIVRLSYVAAVTQRIRILTGIVPVPLYPPVLLAKMATELDLVSGGRLLLGVGVAGEYPPEFEAVNIPTSERGARTDEALQVFEHVWNRAGEPFEGPFTRFGELHILPGPARPGGPPIWVAGRQPPAVHRAARYGDAWMPYMYSPELVRTSIDELHRGAEEAGRAAEEIEVWPSCFVHCDEDGDRARRTAVEVVSSIYRQPFDRLAPKYFVVGTPGQCAERIAEYSATGIHGMMLFPACPLDRFEEQARIIASEIRPLLPGSPGDTSRMTA